MKPWLERRPEVVLAAVTCLWGSTFVVVKDVVREGGAPPLAYLVSRFAIATVILVFLSPRVLRAPRAFWRDALLLGILQGAGLYLQVVGQVYTTASKSSFLTSLSTALTPLLGFALHGERPTRVQLAAIALASCGLCLMTYPASGAAWNTGDLYSLACAAVYGFVIVETARRARRWDPAELTAAQTGFAGLLFAVLLMGSLAIAHSPHAPDVARLELRPFVLDARFIVQLLYMALVCTVLTFRAQMWAMKRMAATHAAIVFALEPVWATVLALAIFGAGEWPGARGAVGAGLILVAVLAAEVGRAGD